MINQASKGRKNLKPLEKELEKEHKLIPKHFALEFFIEIFKNKTT